MDLMLRMPNYFWASFRCEKGIWYRRSN